MLKTGCKSTLYCLSLALSFVLLCGVFLLPAMLGAQEADCDEDCNDHGESVCGCIGCPPNTLACEIPSSEYSPSLNVLSYAIIDSCDYSICDFFDRLDRPPQILL